MHATSPIRRYPDLLVHYQLNNYLNQKPLIEKTEIEKNVNLINKLGRENLLKYREDQKHNIGIWLKTNKNNEYKIIILNWINKGKNIAFIYFIHYHITLACCLKIKKTKDIGDNIIVRNVTVNYNDLFLFTEINV